uniref:Protein kinase n=1 Tax=Marseillevirus LCMAC101 TaxID=2506602 RepID=A0A481YRW0_9VIRU|nr:MAG: protein kinase [Marseillevirus LCMAC101]
MKKTVCIPTQKIKVKRWIIKGGVIGGGSYGVVSQVCRKENCDYAMKVISDSHEVIKREVCFQKICASRGLCKPVDDWWLCDNEEKGVIITPMLHITIFDKRRPIGNDPITGERIYTTPIAGKKDWELIKKAIKLIFRLHEIGIRHGDAKEDNIMLDKDGKPFFIDMGCSGFYQNKDIDINKEFLRMKGFYISAIYEIANQYPNIKDVNLLPKNVQKRILIESRLRPIGDYNMLILKEQNKKVPHYFYQIFKMIKNISRKYKNPDEPLIEIERKAVNKLLQKNYSEIKREWEEKM